MKAWILWHCVLDAPYTVKSDCMMLPVFFDAQEAAEFLDDMETDGNGYVDVGLTVKAVEL